MKPLIREGVIWHQKQIVGEKNPSSPLYSWKYKFSFQYSGFYVYLLWFWKQISKILEEVYFSAFPVRWMWNLERVLF